MSSTTNTTSHSPGGDRGQLSAPSRVGPSAESVPVIEPVSHDSDDNYWSDSASDLTSLTSSITSYVYENGRTYHSFQEMRIHYLIRFDILSLPNDEEEKDRLDLTILDLGTGTGIWALDVADLYPSAKVIGNDLSPIQPEFMAPNVEFVIEDFEEDWHYSNDYFDFIHGRTLSGSVGNWKELFKKAYKHLKPGGWFEMHEAPIWCWSDDGSLKPDSALLQFLLTLEQASSKDGRSLNVCEKLKPWMIEAGFEDVQMKIHKIPWGPWAKDAHLREIGRFQFVNAMESVDSYGLALMTRGMGYSEEHAKIFLAVVKNELRSKSLHAYNLIYFVYGRKPLH